MSDMTISPKPRHLCTDGNYNSAQELFRALATMQIDGMAVAIVLTNNDGQFHTYQFGCDEYELHCCAEALEAWADDIDAPTILEKTN